MSEVEAELITPPQPEATVSITGIPVTTAHALIKLLGLMSEDTTVPGAATFQVYHALQKALGYQQSDKLILEAIVSGSRGTRSRVEELRIREMEVA